MIASRDTESNTDRVMTIADWSTHSTPANSNVSNPPDTHHYTLGLKINKNFKPDRYRSQPVTDKPRFIGLLHVMGCFEIK